MLNKLISIVVILVVVFFMGVLAGYFFKESRVSKQEIKAQEKKIDNTVELKKVICKVDKEIKRYEIKCNDVINFDLSKCL